jgi:hypothetical protein
LVHALYARGPTALNTGFRLIYAYHQQTELIQFVQLYFKADEANEDKERILRHFYVAK